MQQGEKIFWTAAVGYVLYSIYQGMKSTTGLMGIGANPVFKGVVNNGFVINPTFTRSNITPDTGLPMLPQYGFTASTPTDSQQAAEMQSLNNPYANQSPTAENAHFASAIAQAEQQSQAYSAAHPAAPTTTQGYFQYQGPGKYVYSMTPLPGFLPGEIPTYGIDPGEYVSPPAGVSGLANGW